jgi:hypothetical protein
MAATATSGIGDKDRLIVWPDDLGGLIERHVCTKMISIKLETVRSAEGRAIERFQLARLPTILVAYGAALDGEADWFETEILPAIAQA